VLLAIVRSVPDEGKPKTKREAPAGKDRSTKLNGDLEAFMAGTSLALAQLGESLRELRALTSEEGYATRSRLNAIEQRVASLERVHRQQENRGSAAKGRTEGRRAPTRPKEEAPATPKGRASGGKAPKAADGE
jgi:hypothetical protein